MKKHSTISDFPQLHWIANTPVADIVTHHSMPVNGDGVRIGLPNAYFHVQAENGKRQQFAANITCHDGKVISVQANHGMYCRPRDDKGPWTHFEVCVFSAEVGMRWLRYYAENNTYGYVPLAKVEQLLAQHGGEKNGPRIKFRLPRKLKKKLKSLVLLGQYRTSDGQLRPKSKDILLEDAYNRTEKTNSMYRLGTYAGKYRWWTVGYKRVNTSSHRWQLR